MLSPRAHGVEGLLRPPSAAMRHVRDFLQAHCPVTATHTACHRTNSNTRSSGYTREGWRELISTMIDLSHSPNQEAITQYLVTHFPENTRRKPKLIPGRASIRFTEWMVPTLGQRSRDPVQAPDGSIWWAGQWGNLIGRIYPKTGAMTEYPLPDNAMPHSVTLDQQANVWYTGNKNGTVGKLNPDTGEITVYPMPDPAAKDPHTAIFDHKGTMWFTLQHNNRVGRLHPETGDITLVTMPTPKSRPYGIKLDAGGVPWVACNGSNCLVRVDPETMEHREYKLPDPKTTVQRLDFASDGRLAIRRISTPGIRLHAPSSCFGGIKKPCQETL